MNICDRQTVLVILYASMRRRTLSRETRKVRKAINGRFIDLKLYVMTSMLDILKSIIYDMTSYPDIHFTWSRSEMVFRNSEKSAAGRKVGSPPRLACRVKA